jgi:hypothetical protein
MVKKEEKINKKIDEIRFKLKYVEEMLKIVGISLETYKNSRVGMLELRNFLDNIESGLFFAIKLLSEVNNTIKKDEKNQTNPEIQTK